jgi:hypothetical protein
MEPHAFQYGFMLSCPNCDEGTYRFGKTREECAEAWNDWCDERYPAEFTDAMVIRMRRGELTLEQAKAKLHPDPETFPEYEGQGA